MFFAVAFRLLLPFNNANTILFGVAVAVVAVFSILWLLACEIISLSLKWVRRAYFELWNSCMMRRHPLS